ncbi:D-hexose-6-phosphate mutarotase [Vibrio sp. HDW18]|uniref:D-hexose-6-phosphate mutarotase n=1 Tax=Vibrio sp. HDW18 TaxID=2714948 RepID=UPI0014096FBE|nr:D-hexose-6-phosphate mutarotase [Vibrio sp. HDW18]QIL84724.1 D-hexose-6-phosphate mutarotase [Vibrio sp. HDW18]
MDLHALNTVAVLSDCVTIAELDQIKIVRIMHDKASAAISLHGGQVISFQPQGQTDLLWMSPQAIFDGKTALRGGIPICWPWFGRIAAPAHGFARSQEWQLIEHRENEQGVIVMLGLPVTSESLTLWPYQFELRLQVEIGASLKVTLHITNTDHQAWTFSGALHSYLQVGDIQQTETTGIGPTYMDSLQNNLICSSHAPLTLSDAIDRVYTQPEALVTIQDLHLNRKVMIENQGHNSAVVWNPWLQGAQAMSDMNDEGYRHFLCVESTLHAPSLTAGKTLQPGQSHQLITHISAQ